MGDTPQLPADPAELQRLLDDLLCRNAQLRQQAEHRRAEDARRQAEDARRRLDELRRVLDQTAAEFDRLKEQHAALAELLALFRRYAFGPRRERHVDDPGQGHLFDLHDTTTAPEAAAPPPGDSDATAPRPRTARPPRRTRLDHLPRVRIEHDLPEEGKICPCCGGAKQRIGEDLSRELEFIPAKLEVRVHVLPEYACPECRDGVARPPVPPKPTPGGIAGPGPVAFVLVSKFADHLPLYRLEGILMRHGVSLARSTLCDWARNAAELLGPLAELQKARVLQSPVIWTDDTPVTVLGGGSPGRTKGRFWVYLGDAEHPYSVDDFTTSRSRDGPAAFLKDYRGFLQADAHGGYDGIYLDSGGRIVEVACWAHARRKFYDARSSAPREANQVLEWIRQLYDLEDQAREWTPEARRGLRQRNAVPILDRIEASLDELSGRVLPKSAPGQALTYARNQRAALRASNRTLRTSHLHRS